jgi:hypothetical protein
MRAQNKNFTIIIKIVIYRCKNIGDLMGEFHNVSQVSNQFNSTPLAQNSQVSSASAQPHTYTIMKDNYVNQAINRQMPASKNIFQKAWEGLKNLFSPAPKEIQHQYTVLDPEDLAAGFQALLEAKRNEPTPIEQHGKPAPLLRQEAKLKLIGDALQGVANANRLQRSQSLPNELGRVAK